MMKRKENSFFKIGLTDEGLTNRSCPLTPPGFFLVHFKVIKQIILYLAIILKITTVQINRPSDVGCLQKKLSFEIYCANRYSFVDKKLKM